MTILEGWRECGLDEREGSAGAGEEVPPRRTGGLLALDGGLAPVALTGGLVGNVVDRYGLPVAARVIVRDQTGAVAGQCYTGAPRSASAGGRFEIGGLPTGTYVIEIAARGCLPETRGAVPVEAPCVTNVGPIRLLRSDTPSVTVPARCVILGERIPVAVAFLEGRR